MTQKGTGHLPTVDAAHWTITEVPAVDDQVTGPLAPEPDAKGGGEEIEGPEVVGPEQDGHGNALNGQAGGHHFPGAVPVSQNGGGEAADQADQGDDGDDYSGLGQAQALFHGQGDSVDEYEAVASATEGVDQGQVPEGLGAPGGLVEDLGPEVFYFRRPDHDRRVRVPGAVRLDADVGGLVAEEGENQQHG